MVKQRNWNKFIAHYAKEQGVDWKELAERSGMCLSAIYAICGGRNKGLHISTLEKLLDALGLELCVRRKDNEKGKSEKEDCKAESREAHEGRSE